MATEIHVPGGSYPTSGGAWVHPLLREERPVYTDSGLERITTENPVRETLGGMLYQLLRGAEPHDQFIRAVVADSLVQNFETEDVFGEIVRRSASEERWVGYEIEDWTPATLDEFMREKSQLGNYMDGRVRSEMRDDFHKGVSMAIDTGLLRLEVSGQRVYAVPTKTFVDYIAKRVHDMQA